MVILPTEKRFDWKYPPVMLFTIVFLNILIFFLYQSNDPVKVGQAQTLYLESGLMDKELDAWFQYLKQEKDDPEALETAQELYDSEDYYSLAVTILVDRQFYPYLESHSDALSFDAYDLDDTWQTWRKKREQVNHLIDSVSVFRFGLTPNDLSPVTLISHQFLHGDFMHLLGNLLFLMLSGFAVEAAIGSKLFLLLYLASGVAGGLLYAFVDRVNGAPLIGASGAISGVMAMYLGIFRLRQIEFFYWIFIFAGYFRAPALLILPIYIGKELTDYFSSPDSNVAFMAHAGGFVSGGIMTLAVHFIKPSLINREYVEEDQAVDPRREALAVIYQLVEEIKFSAALKQLQAFEQDFGLDFDLQLLRFNLQRALGRKDRSAGFNAIMRIRPQNDQQLQRLAEAWSSNPALQKSIDAAEQLKLAMHFSTLDHFPLAEAIFSHCYHKDRPDSDTGILARKLAYLFGERKDKSKAQYYGEIADHCLAGGN